MSNLTDRRKGMPSIYKATYENGWQLKNLGFDYGSNLLKKTLSNYMFRNTRLATFLENHLQPIMVYWINRVKYLRIYFNFGVPKDYDKIN
jgi:hypothetical protein|tara:strand:- start:224 stop:493 length:270 start_codon:yes stop_codon:yes gene_type:complete